MWTWMRQGPALIHGPAARWLPHKDSSNTLVWWAWDKPVSSKHFWSQELFTPDSLSWVIQEKGLLHLHFYREFPNDFLASVTLALESFRVLASTAHVLESFRAGLQFYFRSMILLISAWQNYLLGYSPFTCSQAPFLSLLCLVQVVCSIKPPVGRQWFWDSALY